MKKLVIPYYKDGTFLTHLITLKKYYNIVLYNGFNNCVWNGGRILDEKIQITEMDIDTYNKFGISIGLTFTNSLLTKEHLNDKNGNELLKNLLISSIKYNIKNEIIINSDILYDYIITKYPESKQWFTFVYSITAHKNFPEFYKNNKISKEKIFKYYTNLFNKYDNVVIHSELIIKQWFYNYLVQNNYLKQTEIIINIIKGCNHCNKYKNHYDKISYYNLNYVANRKKFESSCMPCILEKVPKKFTEAFIPDKHKIIFIKRFNIIKFEGRSINNYNQFIKQNDIILKLKGIQ